MRRFCAISLCLVLAVLPLSGRTGEDVQNGLIDMVAAIDSGDFRRAEAGLRALAAEDPGNDAVFYYLGLTVFSIDGYRSSLPYFRRASELDPSNKTYLESYASALTMSGEMEEAEAVYASLAALDPIGYRRDRVSALIVSLYLSKKDYDSALSKIAGYVSDPSVDADQACDFISHAFTQMPAHALSENLQQIDSVVRCCVSSHPGSVRARSVLMQIASLRKDWHSVIEQCRAIVDLYGGDSAGIPYLATMGDAYSALGESRKAYAVYERVLEADPEYLPTLNNYAYYLSLERRLLGKAARMSLITVEKEPDNPTYLDTYGWILFLRGKPSQAKPFFKHALIYGGKEEPVVLLHYAEVLKALGETELYNYYKSLGESKKQ